MVYTILLYYASRTEYRNPGISQRRWLDAFFVSFQPFRRGMCTTEQTLLRVGVHYYVDDRQKSFMILYILYNIHMRVCIRIVYIIHICMCSNSGSAGLCVHIVGIMQSFSHPPPIKGRNLPTSLLCVALVDKRHDDNTELGIIM